MGARLVPVNYLDADHCADLSVSPAAVAAFPVTNLQSNVRGDAWRSTSLAAQTIAGTFGGNVRQITTWGIWPADASSLIGAQVRVRLWSDVAKTTLVYDSGTIDFFTPTGVVYGTFLWGVQQWGVDNADKTARLAPKVKFIAAVAVSAFEITITNAGNVENQYFEARRILLGDYTEAPYSAEKGFKPRRAANSTQKRAVGGSLRRFRRARWNEAGFEIHLETQAQRQAWHDLCYLADPGAEIFIAIFDPDVDGEKQARDAMWLGSMTVLNPIVWQDETLHVLEIAIAES